MIKIDTQFSEAKMAKIYMTIYFWLFLLVQTALVVFGTELDSPRGIINTVLTYLAFIPAYGYIQDRQLPANMVWRVLIGLFFLWQIAGFALFYGHPMKINLMLLLMMGPFYWAVAGYLLVTMQQNITKKADRMKKRDACKERFKSLFVITSAMALLLQAICFFLMVNTYFQGRHGL